MAEEDLPEPVYPDDEVENVGEPAGEEEEDYEIPPPAQREPVFYAYMRDIIESKEVPEEAKNLMWPLYNRDTKLGKLYAADEYLMHIGLSMYETALVQLKRREKKRLDWEELVYLLGARATEPAVLSRGRHGFERTMQVSQISASVAATGQELKKEESILGKVFSHMRSALGGGGD